MALNLIQTNAYEVTPTLNIKTDTTTAYTFVLGDAANTLVRNNNGSAIAATIPPNASVAFPVGAVLNFAQVGAGQVTVSGGAGVTVTSAGATSATPKTRAQNSAAAAIQTSANNWLVIGDIA
jgi:hypothetical protein